MPLDFFQKNDSLEHISKNEIKIVKKCTLPLTAYREVDLIITERCVLKVTPDGLLLTEINPMYTVEDIKNSTTADFKISPDLKYMDVD